MSLQKGDAASIKISVENIGGINETTVDISPGVSILSGRNATNRSSFLRAIMAALGSDQVSLKGDADEGAVKINFGGDVYNRTLTRRQGSVVLEGDPYLEDAEYAELFAFLVESNKARRAVEQGEDLYEVIMQPVNTERIDTKIKELENDRRQLQAKLDELEQLAQELPKLEEQRTQLEDEIDAKRDELVDKRDSIDALDTDADQASEIETKFEKLREERNKLEDLKQRIADEYRLLEALRNDRSDVEDKIEGLAKVDEDELEELEARIEQRREKIETVESTIDELESVLKFNESVLEESRPEILRILSHENSDSDAGTITDKLIQDKEEIVCWTCGSKVEREQIQETVDVLRNVYSEKMEERRSIRVQIDELEDDRKHIERTRKERDKLRGELDEIEDKIEAKEDRIANLESDTDNFENSIEELEAELDELESDEHNERLELHREINELEFEIDRKESQLADVEEDISEIEARLANQTDLEEELETINDEIEGLRSRIDHLEMESVEQFNKQMDAILDVLKFENLERIWIERVESEVKEGRQKVTKTTFDLHIIRSTDSGSVYEDTVDHLSESERELVGIVFALAGYLVHEVYEQLPIMLLDSLEAFDSERLSKLINYLAEYTEYLVVALLPEDAAALDDDYQRIKNL